MRKTNKIARTLTAVVLAVPLGLGAAAAPTVLAAPGSAAGPQAAQAVPYQIPEGTWGGVCWGPKWTYLGRLRNAVQPTNVWRFQQGNYYREGGRWVCRTSYDFIQYQVIT